MRLAVFGGTFDPPHIGHLITAQFAAEQLDCDVLFVPAADPPHKRADVRSDAEDRFDMVSAAIAGTPAFHLSRIDIDRPGPHFTVDMLQQVQERYPGVELCLLMGTDSLQGFPTWHRPADILALASLAVVARSVSGFSMAAVEAQVPGIGDRTVWIDGPLIDVSSTLIVERMARHQDIRFLVTDPVIAVIEARQLYGQSVQL
jgi:nicotinate-nucleotide adenylyltransferase